MPQSQITDAHGHASRADDGPYREEDVLIALQLLAYLSKYPHVRQAFYKKNNRWTEGLISAAKAVASSTNTLIETADGVLSSRNSPEQLIVASNDVAASTAQLVAASRVKAGFMSKSQEGLETASKAVGAACRALVRQVQSLIRDRNQQDNEDVDYSKLGAHEFKVREMEQQVSFFFFF